MVIVTQRLLVAVAVAVAVVVVEDIGHPFQDVATRQATFCGAMPAMLYQPSNWNCTTCF